MDEAANIYWWIKADGADLIRGLGTSVNGIWSGDQDLADGSLQKAYDAHKHRVDFLSSIGQNKQLNPVEVVQQITVAQQQLVNDIDFICTRKSHNHMYSCNIVFIC